MIPETTESDSVRIFDQIVRDRRSIRGFLSTPVAAEVLERVFETAAFAPSNCNTQPWYSHVVSGEMRDRLSGIFMQTIGQGKHSLDFPYEAKYDGIYRQRQLDVGPGVSAQSRIFRRAACRIHLHARVVRYP
jgi:nitroreductase